MNSFEWNKIFGGILAAALLVMVIRIVTEDVIFAHHDLEEDAFPIEVVEDTTAAPVVEEEQGPSLAELLANATAEQGEKLFRQCGACHTAAEGGGHRIGPNLHGVVGAQVASKAGFNYSSALSGIGGTWTYEKLNTFLTNPRAFAPGTKMSFAGFRKETDRAKVIQFLRSMSPDAPALPKVEAAAEEMMEDAKEETGGMMMAPPTEQ
ncbi:MAG: cytochrome c family protein [Sphingomonadales bacterium]